MKVKSATQAARISNPLFARVFPMLSQALEGGGMATHHRTLLVGRPGRSSTWVSAPVRVKR